MVADLTFNNSDNFSSNCIVDLTFASTENLIDAILDDNDDYILDNNNRYIIQG